MAKTDPVKLKHLKENKEKFERLLRKYYVDKDLTAEQTGVRLGISRFHVRNYMNAFGIKRRNKGQRKGARSMNWKGGKIRHNGYIYVWTPDHPRNSGNYVAEHILVMEKHLGRLLEKGEVIHHKNRIRDDNQPENLKLFNGHADHLKAHWKNREEPKTEHGKLLRDLYEYGEEWDDIAERLEN